ncbi:MAG: DUF4932 domain-containing protein [Ignavibacteriales bacterium]|nr:DUF4932 domain-containing protein [Ignavibacteriales bacterium]
MNRLLISSIFIIFFFFLSCSKDNIVDSNPIDQEEDYALPNPPGLNLKVDPRMELLAVVQHFTTWASQRHTKFDIGYKHDIDNYFSNFSNHPAIQKSQALTNSNFTYDAPVAFVLYHSNPPEFTQITPYSDYLITRAGGESVLKDFADKLRAFAKDTDFMKFYNSKQKFYNHIQNDMIKTIGDTNYTKLLEDYYGEKKHSYNILPAPLFHTGGYGPQVENAEGLDVYNVAGPMAYANGSLSFGNKDYLLYILLHEFSHSFVNPVTTKYSAQINNSKALYEPIKTQMQAQAYSQWETCVNEHLVRTVVARLALKLRGEIYKNMVISQEMSSGFIYIQKLDTLMVEYENDRVKYPNFESFYPRIINLFNSLL